MLVVRTSQQKNHSLRDPTSASSKAALDDYLSLVISIIHVVLTLYLGVGDN